MSKIKIAEENSNEIELYYEDHGSGQPVVLIHGFPMSVAAWEKQVPELLNAGFRTIAYDRRGFGLSGRPSKGYDYDTFAADLNQLMTQLDLRDVVLVGHSMGCGEVIRYLARYGDSRVAKAVCIAPVGPFLLKTADNPEGIEKKVFDEFQKAIREDRFAYLTKFYSDFYHTGLLTPTHVSEEALRHHWDIGASASPIATHECVAAWYTDFRADLNKINLPMLILHGTADKVLPLKITGERMSELVSGSRLVPLDGASHGLLWANADEVNEELLEFLDGDMTMSDSLKPTKHVDDASRWVY